MIKVNKPIDIILNEATHNEHVSYFIDCVNEFLSSQDKFPLNGFRFNILMNDMLTKICMEIRVFFRLIYCAITGNVFISTEEEMRKLHVIDD